LKLPLTQHIYALILAMFFNILLILEQCLRRIGTDREKPSVTRGYYPGSHSCWLCFWSI